jgi:hypothetical protein
MRYLRRQVLNRRAPSDSRLVVDITNGVVMKTPNNMLMPKGTTAQRPVTPVVGMMRYNTDTNEVEVYEGASATWRNIRYKESTGITQQNLGYGDAVTTIFGPLTPAPPTVVENGKTWSGSNLIVVVENVIQLHTTNYTVVNNPLILGVTYSGDVSANTLVGESVLLFDTSTDPIYVSVDIAGASVTGVNVPVGATVQNYTINEFSQLLSVTMSAPAATQINTGTVINIVDSSNSGTGYYLEFSSPVPYGKPVTVLHGFDK